VVISQGPDRLAVCMAAPLGAVVGCNLELVGPPATTWSGSFGRLSEPAAEIVASPRDDLDPPSDEELLAFLDVIYDARRADA
jgi:hypothetical protein